MIGIGVWLAIEVALRRAKNQKEVAGLMAVLPAAILGGVIGARLYHVIDFWPEYYVFQPIKIIYIWEGGLGIWGAIGGGVMAVYIYCLTKKLSFLKTLDGLIVGVPLAQAVGRLGNWMNGELYGKNGEPLFAYEAGLNLILFVFLWWWTKKKTRPGQLTGLYLIGYGLIRILLEGLRPQEIIWKVNGVPMAMIWGGVAVAIGSWLAWRRRS
jgi:phosphatidylglycerol:prolipoprotein diacylglycerol transferase